MIGRAILHYRVTAKLGAGGMGVVYRATDIKLGRDVALKMLPPAQLADPAARARLLREAQTASALNHPHVCHIYEVGDAEGHTFIAMELVEGQPLSKIIPIDGMATEQVLKYAEQMADALAHAHEHGVLHRDLKCSNVVVTPEARIKILDFGLAKRMDGVADAATLSNVSPLTQAGSIAGTLHYLAPEVLGGAPADVRSELWALGVMVYEMAAGAPPFQGRTSFEVTSAILKDSPRPLPAHVSPGLRAVIQRCLAKEPGQRYQHAGEVRAALEAIGSNSSTESRRNLLESGIYKPHTHKPAYDMWACKNPFRRRPRMQGDFRIGEWLVQPQLNQISGNGKSTRVEPKAMQVLVTLAAHPIEVVSKEKLIRAVWADTFVTDDVLTRCISELRKAFDDDAREPRVIETIPKGGYRVLVEVRSLGSTVDGSKARVMLVVAAAVLVTAGFLAWRAARPPTSVPSAPAGPAQVRLAVLPFVNLSHDPEQEYFSDGLTEEMIAQLSGFGAERLAVIARTSIMQYKGTKKTAQQIGRELRVDYLLECSVQRAGNRARITTQLIRAGDQTHLWSHSFDRDLADILSVRREVAQAVAAHIPLLLTPPQATQPAPPKPIQADAYQLFLLGKFHVRRFNGEDLRKAARYFEQAVAREPTFAPAHAGLARAHLELARMFGQIDSREAHPKVMAALERALALDEKLAEAHVLLASAKFDLEFDWTGPALHYQRALALHPNSAEVLEEYSGYLALMGRGNEAVTLHKRAIEFDPLNTDLSIKLGWTLFYARRFEEGIAHHEKLLAMNPNLSGLSHYLAGWHYSLKGRHSEAIRECEITKGDHLCAYVYAAAGRRAEALHHLRNQEKQLGQRTMKTDQVALAYIPLGEKDRVFALLERAYRERSTSLAFLKAEPIYDPIRNDPRFIDLLRRMNFPK